MTFKSTIICYIILQSRSNKSYYTVLHYVYGGQLSVNSKMSENLRPFYFYIFDIFSS